MGKKAQSVCRVRYFILLSVLAVAGASLVWRISHLNITQRDFLLKQSDARIRRQIHIPAHRGMITDRHGKPLAISAQVFAVWVNPKLMTEKDESLKSLVNLLEIKKEVLEKKLNTDRSFVYLKRGLSPEVSNKINALKLAGVFIQPEYKRFYPEAEVTSHVIGFTNIDDVGQEGIELAYNSYLRGIPGKKEVIKDRVGNIVDELRSIREPKEGHDLALSLDSRVQYLAYLELKKAMTEYNATAGSIVILDVETNEVLAMVNQPSFNPNHIVGAPDGRHRNRAVTDQFEPGSTMKAFTIVSILNSGKFKPADEIDTNPGWINLDGHVIEDVRNFETVSVVKAIEKSSNVAMCKMALELAPEDLTKTLRNVGFGESTYSGFPGEVAGQIADHRTWKPIEVATLSIGYGVATTTLQLAQAYSVLANHGVRHKVSLLKADESTRGARVLNSEVVDDVMQMLESVVKTGTGRRAKVKGYRVAGKTGTAHIAGANGYDQKRAIASFVGIAPVSKPKLVAAVVIFEPKPKHYGGLVAAPVFSKVMGGALRLLNVPPDDVVKS